MIFPSFAPTRRLESVGRQVGALFALFALTACAGMGEAMSAHTDVVARAGGNELRVDEAAQMLASNPQIPADPQVVRALADLWIDYSLLASAVAEDSTLSALDIEGFIAPIREQALISQLRDQVIEVDTIFDDAEIERRWSTEGPDAEIRARHILLRTPTGADDAQRDSVVALAESLRQRAAGGESFSDLATEYSQDPGSAARGGDLGFFSRGRMVEPFEDAAFELQAGEVSEVVETPFGYHVIMVEERRQPELGEQREQFRQFLVRSAVDESERAYLDGLAADANVQIAGGAMEVVREIAGRPEMELGARAAERAIVTYDGGSFTAAEFAEFIREQPPQTQNAFASAPPEQLESGLEQLVQMELLVAEAEERGLTVSAEEEERIRTEARAAIREVVEASGFAAAARGGATATSLDAMVKSLVESVVSGQQAFVPLGRLGGVLRDLYTTEINDASFPDVIARLEEIRASQPAPAPMPGQPGVAPGQPGVAPGQPGIAPGQAAPPLPDPSAVPAPQPTTPAPPQ